MSPFYFYRIGTPAIGGLGFKIGFFYFLGTRLGGGFKYFLFSPLPGRGSRLATRSEFLLPPVPQVNDFPCLRAIVAPSSETGAFCITWSDQGVPEEAYCKAISACAGTCGEAGTTSFQTKISQTTENAWNVRMGLLGWTWKVMVLLGCQTKGTRSPECRAKKGIRQEGQGKAHKGRTGHRQGQEEGSFPWIRCYAIVFLIVCTAGGECGRPSDLAEGLFRFGAVQPAIEAPRRFQRTVDGSWQTHGGVRKGQAVSTAKDPEYETKGSAEVRTFEASSTEKEVSNDSIPRTDEETIALRDAKVSKRDRRVGAKHQGDAGTMSQTRSRRDGRDGDPALHGCGRRPGHALGIDEFLNWRCCKNCPTTARKERDGLHGDAVEDTSGSHDDPGSSTMVEQPIWSSNGCCRYEPRITIGCFAGRIEGHQKTKNGSRVRGARDRRLPRQRGRIGRRNGLNPRGGWQQDDATWLVVVCLYDELSDFYRHAPENSNYRPMLYGCSGSLEGLVGLSETWSCHPSERPRTHGLKRIYNDWYARKVESCISSTDEQSPPWHAKSVEGCTSIRHETIYTDTGIFWEYGLTNDSFQRDLPDIEDYLQEYMERMIWILRCMMFINKISMVVITLAQSIVTIGRRLCFLEFDKGKHSALQEMIFQHVRAPFWMCATFIWMVYTTRRRSKSMKIIQKRRYSVGSKTPKTKTNRLQVLIALMVFNSHVVQAVHKADTKQYHDIDISKPPHKDLWQDVDDHRLEWQDTNNKQNMSSTEMQTTPHIQEMRLTEGSVVQGSSLDLSIFELPNTIGEALTHPRRLRLLNSWNDLQMLLIARGQTDEETIHYYSYGLRGNDRGVRTTQLHARQSGDLIGAMQVLWQDEIGERSFQIHIINPQPVDIPFQSVAILVEIFDMSVDVDFMAPILLECISIHKAGPDTDHMLRTDYVPRRSTAEDVYELGRVTRLCPPSGTMQCMIETATDISYEREDRLTMLSGYYVVLQVTPGEWYDFSCDSCFHGIGAFAREAIIMIPDPFDPYIYVRTFATFDGAIRADQRGFLLHRRFFHDVETVWNMVAATWSDRCNEDSLRVIYSPTPPQVADDQEVTLLATDSTQLGHIPIVVTLFDLQGASDSWDDNLGTYVIEVPPDVEAHALTNQLPDDYQYDDCRIWCENNFYGIEDTLPVEPGSHVMIYANQYEGEEEPESSEATEDPVVNDDSDNGCGRYASSWLSHLLGLTLVSGRHTMIPLAILSLHWFHTVHGISLMCGNSSLDSIATQLTMTRLHRLPDDPIPCGQVIRMCPMPQNPIEAWEQRPPRTGIMDYNGLRVMLSEERITILQPALIDTYGLQEHSVGYRRVTVADLQQRTIALAIAAAWNDFAFQFSIVARIVRPQPRPLTQPQPILIMIIQILDPFAQIAENAVPVLVDQITSVDMDDVRQAMTTRVAEYVLTPTHGHDIASLVRMGRSCQPKGLRQCHINWRGNRFDMQTMINPRASEYIILTAGPLGLHFRGADNYFYRARRFALDGQRLMSQILNVEVVDLEVHAISHNNEPLGARVIQLRMGDFIQPQETWRRATELWQDKGAGDTSKLYHVDTQPSFSQQAPEDILHVILVVTPHATDPDIIWTHPCG